MTEHRMPGEFYYGFEPPEPVPVGKCAWCGEPVYNMDHIYNYEVICPECEKYAYKGSTALDYIIYLFKEKRYGSLESFFKDMKGCDWLESFGESVRTYFSEDFDLWVKF